VESTAALLATIQAWLDILGPNPWLRAAVMIVAAFIVAFIVERIIVATIGRLVGHTKTLLDDELIERSRRPVFMTILVAGLVIATRQLELSERVTDVTISALQTILIFVWLGFALRFFSILLHALSRMREKYEFIQPSTLPLFDNTAKIAVAAAGVYLAFLAWNIDVTALIASAGIVGLALSFAAQDTLANIFGGMSILADRPYQVGDFINLDTGERGEVTQIGLRSTRLVTRDDVEVSIPNAVMGNAKIVNEAGGPHEKFRIRISVGVAYGSDIDQVQQLLLEVAESHDEVCTTPKARVRLRGFGNSSLDFELLAWVARPILRGRICHELNCAVYKTFVAHDVEIPFPQQDIHVRDLPAPTQPSSG
jgi:MscS family membrane protein